MHPLIKYGNIKTIIPLTGLVALMILFTFCLPEPLSAKPVISDDNIENAVEDEYLFDQAVPLFRITVTCVDGILTLDGTVDNLLAKERALKIAETVKGIRSVINQIQVSSISKKSDEQLRREISQALIINPATESYEINISVSDNHVSLRGRVDSLREKNLAETVVKGVSGVKSVNNNIGLSMVASERSDDDIFSDISQGLKWNALVDHELIKVAVEDGTAHLTGVVGSAAEKKQAVITAWVSGVRRVDTSGLETRYWARDPMLRKTKYELKSNEEIKTAVESALEKDPKITATDLSVFVSNGIVTLKGQVDSLKSCRVAVQDTRNTVGVAIVKNHLKVKPLPVFVNDTELEQIIENAFKRDTYVEDYEITVDVNNGVADLYGSVDTYFEKARAEDVASIIQGIYAVDNNIQIQKGWIPYFYNPFVDETNVRDYGWYAFKGLDKQKQDWKILRSIKQELWWSPFVDEDQVNVEVDDGRATLTGQVDSMMEYDAATENALEGGAVSVDNDLVVSNLTHPKKN